MPFKETFTSKSSLIKQMTHLQNKAKEDQQNTGSQNLSTPQDAPRETTRQELNNKFMLSLKLKTLLHELYKYGVKNCSATPELLANFHHFMSVLVRDVLTIEPALQRRGWSGAPSQLALSERGVMNIQKNIYQLGLFQTACLEEQIEQVIQRVPRPVQPIREEAAATQGGSHSSPAELDLDLELDLDDNDVQHGPS